MREVLVKDFDFIQSKIDEIIQIEKLDIKLISDLERYVGMQKDIIQSLLMLEAGVE